MNAGARGIITVLGHQYQWLAGGYDLEIGHYYKWLAWWLPDGLRFFVQCHFSKQDPSQLGMQLQYGMRITGMSTMFKPVQLWELNPGPYDLESILQPSSFQ